MTVPLLLIPGLNCTERAFLPLVGALWPLTSVTVVNHRRGDSMAAIASAILAEAPPRFALLGFSMGGYIAFEMLRQAPERVDRLCCLATMARPDTAEQAENRRRMIALAEQGRFDQVIGANYPNTVHPDNVSSSELRELHATMARETGAETYVAQQRAILARPDSRADLAGIRVPTCVVVGEADMVTGVDGATEIADGVPGAELTMVPGAGHMVPLEQPAAVGKALARWLGR
jgi:Predicted hydrolases or acyltransferases (alpha/beta hydrolase superfamily)